MVGNRVGRLLIALQHIARRTDRHHAQHLADRLGHVFVAQGSNAVGLTVVPHLLPAGHLIAHVDAFDRVLEGHRAVGSDGRDPPELRRVAFQIGGLRRAGDCGFDRSDLSDLAADFLARMEFVLQQVLGSVTFGGFALGIFAFGGQILLRRRFRRSADA